MAQQIERPRAAAPAGILTGYRWLATLFAALIVVQAFLGIRGFFANPDLIDVHEMLANLMFLIAIGQTVLAWLLHTRGGLVMGVVALNALLVLLTIAQIGLGYSTREADSFETTISLHVPNGVLLMGVSTVVAVMAWQFGRRAPVA